MAKEICRIIVNEIKTRLEKEAALGRAYLYYSFA
jgi:hypothetical protein